MNSAQQVVVMSQLSENEDKCAQAVNMLKAIAHPIRLRIIAILCDEDEHVNGLAERLGTPQSVVSQQLRILRMSSLVSSTRQGGFAVYSLAEPRLRELIGCMNKCCST